MIQSTDCDVIKGEEGKIMDSLLEQQQCHPVDQQEGNRCTVSSTNEDAFQRCRHLAWVVVASLLILCFRYHVMDTDAVARSSPAIPPRTVVMETTTTTTTTTTVLRIPATKQVPITTTPTPTSPTVLPLSTKISPVKKGKVHESPRYPLPLSELVTSDGKVVGDVSDVLDFAIIG